MAEQISEVAVRAAFKGYSAEELALMLKVMSELLADKMASSQETKRQDGIKPTRHLRAVV